MPYEEIVKYSACMRTEAEIRDIVLVCIQRGTTWGDEEITRIRKEFDSVVDAMVQKAFDDGRDYQKSRDKGS